jgi:transposase
MTSTSTKDASDAKRWLIIGAHQAGASEKRVARISGLSKTAVRHIILNYQRTGNPCLPKREPKKGRKQYCWKKYICMDTHLFF